MIRSATLLMREHGVERTAFTDVVARSGAPRGSIYHYFPGGKAQLIEEATRGGGAFIAAGLTAAFDQGEPLTALTLVADYWRGVLAETDFGAGCPVAAATVAGASAPTARDAAGEAFRAWLELIAEALRGHGVPAGRAEPLASLIVTSIEGAIVVARAQRSLAPFDDVVDLLRRAIRDALAD